MKNVCERDGRGSKAGDWTEREVETKEIRANSRNRGREGFWRGRGGLKRVLAFPLEEVLMPYWMQLLMNRCAVCGHCDPGSTSCMATHPIEVHRSRGGERQASTLLRRKMKGQPHRVPLPWTHSVGGRDAAQSPQDRSFRV